MTVLVSVALIFAPVAPVPSSTGSEREQPAAVNTPAVRLNPHYYQEDQWLFPDASIVDSRPVTLSSESLTPLASVHMGLSAGTVLAAPTDLPVSAPPTSPAREPNLTEMVDSIFGWPGAQLVQCESRWNRWAVGAAGERGLFQIHPLWIPEIRRLGWTWDDMFEAEPNIRMAAHIRRVQGLRAWTCWKG